MLDPAGRELIHLNDARPVAANQLQDKTGRDYFTVASKLAAGKVYLGPLDLNEEHGVVEEPERPMLRFATPVFDPRGELGGVIVLNYAAAHLIAHVAEVRGSSETVLANREGYFLFGRPPAELWGFMYVDRINIRFATIFPEEWTRIARAQDGQFESINGVFAFETVTPGAGGTGA